MLRARELLRQPPPSRGRGRIVSVVALTRADHAALTLVTKVTHLAGQAFGLLRQIGCRGQHVTGRRARFARRLAHAADARGHLSRGVARLLHVAGDLRRGGALLLDRRGNGR